MKERFSVYGTTPVPWRPAILDDQTFCRAEREGYHGLLLGREVSTPVGLGLVHTCWDGRIRVQVQLLCALCAKRTMRVHLAPTARGLTAAHTTKGTYLADLADRDWVCQRCRAYPTRSS